jgi:hypothetical protein
MIVIALEETLTLMLQLGKRAASARTMFNPRKKI